MLHVAMTVEKICTSFLALQIKLQMPSVNCSLQTGEHGSL